MTDNSKFDFASMMQQFDPMNMAKQFQEMLANTPLGNMDTEAMLASQRKSLESLISANQSAVNGTQALFARQSEMLQQMLNDTQNAIQKMAASQPDELPAEQTAMVEQAVKKSMENFAEISAMVQSTYGEVSEKVEQRMKESAEELNEALAEARKSV